MFQMFRRSDGTGAALPPDEIVLDANAVDVNSADYVELQVNEALAPLGLRFGGLDDGDLTVLVDGTEADMLSDDKLVAEVKSALKAPSLNGKLDVQSVSVA